MIERIKLLLGISDDKQDPLLSLLIDLVEGALVERLEKPVPKSLEYIIIEVVTARYNRIGSEGMKSETTGGHRIEFNDINDFAPYLDIIASYRDDIPKPTRGKVHFI